MQNEFKGLRHYIDIVESAQQTSEDAASAGQTVGNIAGGAAGLAALPVRGAVAAGQWLGDKAGQAWDAAKQGVSNFAGGVAQGAQQGWQATSPQALAGGAAKTPTTPEEIKAFQQANGLTPDGIIGPKTLAAMKAKGMQAPAAGQGASKTPAAGQGASKTPAKPGVPAQTQTQQNMAAAGMAGQEMRTQAEIDASKDMLSANNAGNINAGLTPDDPRWKGPKPAAAAAAPATQGQGAMATPNPWEGKDPAKAAAWAKLTPAQQKWMGGADPTDPNIVSRAPKAESMAETVGYAEDPALARIVSLVNYTNK